MKRVLLLTGACLFIGMGLSAQRDLPTQFDAAYRAHPSVPRPLLEALAYSASHLQNLQPEEAFDEHHGPGRYGLFALIEDGKGYFANNLLAVCRAGGITTAEYKRSTAAQIMAVAAYLDGQCQQRRVAQLAQMAPVVASLSEIPEQGNVNAFARASALYEVYQNLQKGIDAGGILRMGSPMAPENWFTPGMYRMVTAPGIVISEGQVMTADGAAMPQQGPAMEETGMAAVTATDYPPALWVASPNFSSRTVAISAITVHTTQGSYAGSISWFQNTASQVSAHYVLRSSDGQVTQMVREASKAWHVGSENGYTIGLEHEGFVNDASWYTTAMYNASAALVRDICADNGIAPTACYSGAASSGVNVLASSVKIKGHQHYPNQSHTDPGINWNWGLYYNLINPVSCGASATQNESYISTAFANLNWSSVSGAVSYTLDWKASAAATWNSVSVANNYYTLSGLAASSSYNWRVRANCSGGSGAYSAARTFTTQASCWDPHEANNVYTSPKTLTSLSGYTYGKVCGSGDVDFYKITTTATQNIIFKLATLPKNYNIETYTGAGAYIAGGYAAGTADETVTLFNRPAGSYLFRVYGATATDNDALRDYRLQITLAPPTAARFGEEGADQLPQQITIHPNPVSDKAMLLYQATQSGQAQLVVTDFYGRPVYSTVQRVQQGLQQIVLDAGAWGNGLYMVSIMQNGRKTVQRLVVQR
jgi:N-acetyl-anhydromuramyl-L-alanine amidase AmpD